MKLHREIETLFQTYKNNKCVICDDTHFTYGQFYNHLLLISDWMTRKGVSGKQCIILKFKSNSLSYLIALFSIILIDGIICLLPSEHRLESNEIQFDWILSDEQSAHSESFNLGREIILNLERLCEKSNDYLTNEFQKNDVVAVLPTSGTTGKAKWVLLSSENILFSIKAIYNYMQPTSEDVFMPLKSFAHISTLTSDLLLSFLSGASLVLVPESFMVRTYNPIIEKHKVTIITAVPSILSFMLHFHPERYLSSVKKISLVGGPASVNLLKQSVRLLPEAMLYCGYGLTEAASRVTYLHPDDLLTKCGSIGKPLPGISVNLTKTDDGSKILKPFETGEMTISGPNIMVGYLRDGLIYSSSNLKTRDMAYVDEEGYLYHQGRADDIIILNGINISALYIEKAIEQLNGVLSAHIFVEQRPSGVETLVALVLKQVGVVLEENEIFQYARKELSRTQIPKRIIITEVLPSIFSEKVSRSKLKEFYLGRGELNNDGINHYSGL